MRAPGSSATAGGKTAGSSWAGSDIVRFFGLGVGPFARVQLLSSKFELLRRRRRGFSERGGVGTIGLHRSGRDRQGGHQVAAADRIFGCNLGPGWLNGSRAGGLTIAHFAQVSLAFEV